MRPIEKDLERQAEIQRVEEAIAQRQEIQFEKLAVYQEHCQSERLEPISNIKSIFTTESERSIVVICVSQAEAEEATKNCKQEEYVFLSVESAAMLNSSTHEKGLSVEDSLSFERDLKEGVDLSILEDRKILVWGSELERLGILERLADYENMHARETDYDFTEGFEDKGIRSDEVVGSWSDLEKQEKEIDIQLGIEEEQQNHKENIWKL